MNEPWERYAKEKKLATKDCILLDSIYTKCAEQSNLQTYSRSVIA